MRLLGSFVCPLLLTSIVTFAFTASSDVRAQLKPVPAPPPSAKSVQLPSTTPPPAKLISTNGGATVYDVANNRTWLADANLPATMRFGVDGINVSGSMNYEAALAWIKALNVAKYQGHSDWQLPTTPPEDPDCQSHNRYAFGFGCRNSAFGRLYYGALGLTDPQTAVKIPSSATTIKGFSNFQPYLYWSATVNPTHEDNEKGYTTFSFVNGFQGSNVTKNFIYVLPMVDADVQPANVADAARVVHHGNVTWLADANLAATETFGVGGIAPTGAMPRDIAEKWIAGMNRHNGGKGYLGINRWQLPPTYSTKNPLNGPPSCPTTGKDFGYRCTLSPLGKLYYDYLKLKPGEAVVAAPNTKVSEFKNIQPYLYWSCHRGSNERCATQDDLPVQGFGWSFSFGNGFEGTTTRNNDLFVTAYYPGR